MVRNIKEDDTKRAWFKMREKKAIEDNAKKEQRDAYKAAGLESLLIGERINVPGESKAYDTERWKKEVDYTSPKNIPGEIKEVQPVIPGLEDLLAQGAGLDGFLEPPSVDAVIDKVINDENLSGEEKESTLRRILGDDGYNNYLQQKELQKSLMIQPQQLAMSPADVPLGDGMINQSKNLMQENLKQKYDMMLQNGFIDEVEYRKQMDRLFGTQFGTQNKKKK